MRVLHVMSLVGALGFGQLSMAWSQDIGTAPGPKNSIGKTLKNSQPGSADPVYDPYSINQTPWFSNSAVRSELNLTDDQYNRLNKGYTQSWTRYNSNLSGLKSDLAQQERLRQRQELYGTFHKDFSTGMDDIVTDAAARRRYQQLHWQYRGYGAFNDPAIQKQLKLTDPQRLQLSNYDREWNTQMQGWNKNYAAQRDITTKRYNESRAQYHERINSTLTPEQQAAWSEMAGKPYDFPADVYLSSPKNAQSKSGVSVLP